MDSASASDPKVVENGVATEHEDKVSSKLTTGGRDVPSADSFAHLDEKKILRKVRSAIIHATMTKKY